ncbi:MAG TPA: nuclear transport factor 2 family protein [Candidatus Dormibacteraeota bacterium]|jgi:ketosteroid isomerase-like protein|nr:nuclear transport factor 2 family protein [Candidatus Dormibacteraeota bacterium]
MAAAAGSDEAANEALLHRFYTAFQALDADGMNACYAPDASFSDPVFQRLTGDRARAMWRMLASRSKGIELTYEIGAVDGAGGAATWVARYEFSATGRQVENHVSSAFQIAGGRITRQDDSFDLWRWAAMALGPRGLLLGWLPPVQASIRKQAAANLDRFVQQQG